MDVAALVTADGTYSIRVTSPSDDGADYWSSEHSADLAPHLIVQTR